jgi:hypothetical protein
MDTIFYTQTIKCNFKKLIRRLGEHRILKQEPYLEPTAEEIQLVREQNRIFHERKIRETYFYTYK